MPAEKKFADSYWPGFLMFLISVIIGLTVYQDYGVAWDEPIQNYLGEIAYKYTFHGDKALLTYTDRNHGIIFELLLTSIEKIFSIKDFRDIFLMRHLVSHLLFLVSVFGGYVLCMRLFKNQLLSCLGFILFAFNPRIYAHSFFNTKDIPFFSALIIVMLVLQVAFEKRNTIWFIVLGIACGYATSIRIMGIMFVACISLFFIIDLVIRSRQNPGNKKTFAHLLVFLASFCGALYATWPLLWSGPFFYFKEELDALSHFNWFGEVLLNGIIYNQKNIPWFYIPTWFGITIPVLWLAGGLTGLGWVIVSFIKNPINSIADDRQRNFLFYTACFILPVLAVIVLHSVVYDDWRHLYFIYAPFVMLSLFTLQKLSAGKKGKLIIFGLALLQTASTTAFMVSNHPFEQVYFNEITPHSREFLRKNYDLDYWGCSDKQAFEYLLAHDKSDSISVFWSQSPVGNNYMMLPKHDRGRIRMVNETTRPAYFITNFRAHPGDYSELEPVYEISVQNSTILKVYKQK